MEERDAIALIGVLVTSTTGWNDDSTDVTVTMMTRRWESLSAAREAVDRVVSTWTQLTRPTWGVLHEAYLVALRRQTLDAPAITEGVGGMIVKGIEGRKIAARAYASECHGRDPETDPLIRSGFRSNKPSQAVLDQLLGVVPDE